MYSEIIRKGNTSGGAKAGWATRRAMASGNYHVPDDRSPAQKAKDASWVANDHYYAGKGKRFKSFEEAADMHQKAVDAHTAAAAVRPIKDPYEHQDHLDKVAHHAAVRDECKSMVDKNEDTLMTTLQDAKQDFFTALKAAREDSKPLLTSTPTGGVTQATYSPTNVAAPQIYTAQEAVRSLSNHIQHPCSINHDAATTGVRHASMMIHPEWNQDHVKEQADDYLKDAGFKGKKAEGYEGKTYEHPQTGAKVHMAKVGKHLVITSDDKKGTKATPYTPNPEQDGSKKPKARGK